ncbi:MAG: Gfo/Idh/MocA family oxidoreductase [Gemmatimonadetes bacterium]|nr:Gfo/Idh/MocA family oxidoreductase [Gemmatimonadota bacterium]
MFKGIARAEPPQHALRIAFAGAGRMAACHLRALGRVNVPHAVGAVYDSTESRVREFAARAGARAYLSMSELLEDFEPHVVHVCTPRGAHFELAHEALRGGAHVYVEKPLVEMASEARALLRLAREKHLLVCAGHQLTRDPAFGPLLDRAAPLQPIVAIDSHFAFRPVGIDLRRAGRRVLADQLADILPHPLYALLATLERFGATPAEIESVSLHATPTDVHALLRAKEMVGRLSVTLRGRPVASTLTVTGAGGSLTADFVRSTITGAGNTGTQALEKVFNPSLEGWQLGARGLAAVARRLTSGIEYPGLAELINDFYRAVADGLPSPVDPAHLQRVTEIYEELVANMGTRVPMTPTQGLGPPRLGAPVAVVTGASGFLGSRIARHLARWGYRVRGISRAAEPEGADVHEWVRADLGDAVPAAAFAGAEVVVHAAAETDGEYDAHQRNSVDATRNVLRALQQAGVSRLVYVSSLSVLQPAVVPWKRLHERSPLVRDARPFGPYTWGKVAAERAVLAEAGAHGLEVRIVRPAALVDFAAPEVPGLVGRPLFGRWHLGLGHPWLRIAVCNVDRCAAVIGWCAARFDDAPRAVNLIDPTIEGRGQLLELFRVNGWEGRMVWVPISVVAAGFALARALLSLLMRQSIPRLKVWSVLRPQRYDASASRAVLEAAMRDTSHPRAAVEEAVAG